MTELLAKYFSGNITEKEKRDVLDWRNENDQNAEEFFEYSFVWNNEELSKGSSNGSYNASFNSIIAEPDIPSIKLNPKSLPNYYKYAAVVVLAVVSSILLYNNVLRVKQLDVIGTSQVQETILSDGSKVFLSQGARIIYPEKFSVNSRQVSLEGRAFFEVEKDQSRPFIIKTPESQVKVLGTSFLVNSDMSTHQTEVIVKTGKVAVSSLLESGNNNIVELIQGEAIKVVASDSDLVKFTNENSNFLSWKSKTLTFNNHNLTDVLEVIEDAYGVDVVVSEEQIKNCDLSATYRGQTVESIMEILSHTFGLKLQKLDTNTFKLTGKACANAL